MDLYELSNEDWFVFDIVIDFPKKLKRRNMIYSSVCKFNLMKDPTISLQATDSNNIFTIFYFIEVKEQSENIKRIFTKQKRTTDTTKGFPVDLLEWEFVLRSSILYFMEQTPKNVNAVKAFENKAKSSCPSFIT